MAVLTFHQIITMHARAPFPTWPDNVFDTHRVLCSSRGRKPFAIRRAFFGYLTFDKDGMFDPSEPHRCAMYSVKSLTKAPLGPVRYAVPRIVTGSSE